MGGLNLALALLTAVAAVRLRPELTRLAAAATLVYTVPHLLYHVLHLEPYGLADAVANVVALGSGVLVPVWLVLRPAPPARRVSSRTGHRGAAGEH